MTADLRRVVVAPDGSRYQIIATAKDWKLGTGSLLLDAAAFVWAAVRQARGKEWVVLVRPVDSDKGPVIKRVVKTENDAASAVAELAEAIESGQLTQPSE